MRTNDDILQAVHDRAKEMKRQKQKRQTVLLGSGAVTCALVLIALMIIRVSDMTERLNPENAMAMQASILADSGLLGYAVVSIVAFLLGVMVTLFCILLRDRNSGEKKDHDRDR